MPGFSKALAQQIFDATLASSRTTLTAKPGVWMSLHTAAPDDNTGGVQGHPYTGFSGEGPRPVSPLSRRSLRPTPPTSTSRLPPVRLKP